MKTILFPTDFSKNAIHAVKYGYYLARQVKADIVLFNAVIIPAEAPQAGLVVWPMEESDILLKDSTSELIKLKSLIEKSRDQSGFLPAVRCLNQSGILTAVVNEVISAEKIDLVVIGTHGSSGITTLLLGNHSRSMIDSVTCPLLLIPPASKLSPVKKIAFATDFKNPEEDIFSISLLAELATPLNAEIVITHIYEEEDKKPEFQQWIKRFVKELPGKVNFSNIKYKMYKSNGAQSGLEWLCDNGQMDLLAMVHRSHNFIDSIFRGSQTQKMAGEIPIPLLVFPARS